MDTVTQLGLSQATLGQTHQSDPATSKPGGGAPTTASTSGTAQHTPDSKQAQHNNKKKNDQAAAVDEFLNNLRTATTRLRISLNDKMGVFVYQSVDPQSGQVKAQYPSEERLRELAFLAELDSKKNGTTV